jgi:hypothetical protein
MGILSDLLGGVAADLYDEIPSEITELYTTQLPQISAPDITFQPFTVTSGMGTVTGWPTGTEYQLGGTQQAIQDQLMQQALSQFRQGVTGVPSSEAAGLAAMGGGRRLLAQPTFGVPSTETAALQAFGAGSQFLGQAGAAPADVEALRQQYAQMAGQSAMDVLTPTAAREASVYDRIRATQRPEEERQRLALEERLAQQGRLGVRTAMFGGTPEQMALSKAQEEAQDRASLAAMQQAQAQIAIDKQKAEADIAIKQRKMEADIQLQREKMMQELELKKQEFLAEAQIKATKVANDMTGNTEIPN